MGNNVGVLWNEVPKEDRNGPLVSHMIVYKNCSMDKEKNVSVNISEATDYYYIINLGPGPYAFKVIARNSKGICKDCQWTKMVSEERFKKRTYFINKISINATYAQSIERYKLP